MHAAFFFRTREEMQHPDTQIKAVEDGVPDDEYADEEKPYHVQVHYATLSFPVSGAGPCFTFFTSRYTYSDPSRR